MSAVTPTAERILVSDSSLSGKAVFIYRPTPSLIHRLMQIQTTLALTTKLSQRSHSNQYCETIIEAYFNNRYNMGGLSIQKPAERFDDYFRFKNIAEHL